MSDPDLRAATILVVDDEDANLELLEACLTDDGYVNIKCTRDPTQVVELYRSLQPDLLLLDLHMPKLDGFGVLEQLRELTPEDEYLPVLVLTADVTQATKQRALSGGAHDFLTKPLEITEVLLRIRNLLQTRFLHERERAARAAAEAAERRAMVLAHASQVLASSFDYHTTLARLCRTLVPEIADYCVVDVLRDDGSVVREGLAHVDPEKETLLADFVSLLPSLPEHHPTVTALRQGRRTLADEITPDMVEAATGDDEHRRILQILAQRSLITVPLDSSGRIQGALSLVYSESPRRYTLDDLELSIELARRTAMTIENARLYARAQQATRARDEMLGIVAHDLRNPLSTITMGSSLLIETATSDPQRRHAELVRRAADRMQRLIEDLLEVRRIEVGKLTIQLRPEPARPVVREAVDMLRPLAAAKNIELEARLADDLPPVRMDAARVLQVFSNLVGNALKFTPEGGRIRIGCERAADDARFFVEDTGPGIPREQLPHVFHRFWQASYSDVRGIGLGLSIVRGIVDAHGGRVWVESELGQGATFYFTLPLADGSDDREDAGWIDAGEPIPIA